MSQSIQIVSKTDILNLKRAAEAALLDKGLAVKSGHLSEGLAAGLGHGSQASLLAALKDSTALVAVVDDPAFVSRLGSLGYAGVPAGLLSAAARSFTAAAADAARTQIAPSTVSDEANDARVALYDAVRRLVRSDVEGGRLWRPSYVRLLDAHAGSSGPIVEAIRGLPADMREDDVDRIRQAALDDKPHVERLCAVRSAGICREVLPTVTSWVETATAHEASHPGSTSVGAPRHEHLLGQIFDKATLADALVAMKAIEAIRGAAGHRPDFPFVEAIGRAAPLLAGGLESVPLPVRVLDVCRNANPLFEAYRAASRAADRYENEDLVVPPTVLLPKIALGLAVHAMERFVTACQSASAFNDGGLLQKPEAFPLAMRIFLLLSKDMLHLPANADGLRKAAGQLEAVASAPTVGDDQGREEILDTRDVPRL